MTVRHYAKYRLPIQATERALLLNSILNFHSELIVNHHPFSKFARMVLPLSIYLCPYTNETNGGHNYYTSHYRAILMVIDN